MAKLVDKEGIESFQKIRQLSEEIAKELKEEIDKPISSNATLHFWDLEEEDYFENLTKTKQVA